MSGKNPNSSGGYNLTLVVFAASILLLLWWLWAENSADLVQRFSRGAQAGSLEEAARWGDSFGPFNALISTGGLALVLITLRVQMKALNEQRSDLHRQRFESSFFEILRLIREYRNSFEYRFSDDLKKKHETETKKSPPSGMAKGDQSYRAAAFEVLFWLKYDQKSSTLKAEDVSRYYDKYVHDRYETVLAPYYRLIYTVLMRIKIDKVLSLEEKESYGNLLRSQLSTSEVMLLALNGLSTVSKDMDKLITQFRLLKYMHMTGARKRLANLYPREAFSART